jgi:hypothetical protein
MKRDLGAPVTRFTKIKFDGAKVRLEYQVTRPGGGDPDEFALQCADRPLPEFVSSLAALRADVCQICEFPSKEVTTLTMRGVSLAYKDGVMGCVLTALRTVTTADAPLILNTPYLPQKAQSGCLLPASTVRRVNALHVEAARYLAGEREQGSLFTDSRPLERPPSLSGGQPGAM